MSSLDDAWMFVTSPSMYSGTCDVISLASLVSVSLSTKYSHMPDHTPRLEAKYTYLPDCAGLALRDASNSVVLATLIVSGVSTGSPVTLNCVRSEKSSRLSLNGTACLSRLTLLEDTATSMGSLSTMVSADLRKKSKSTNSPAREKITFSSARSPSLLRWKKISANLNPIKEGKGLVSSLPIFLSS